MISMQVLKYLSSLQFKYDIKIFKSFIADLFSDISSRSSFKNNYISVFTFHTFFSLPFHISEKIFNAFDSQNKGKLNKEEFTSGILSLYTGNYEERSEIIFKIFDFDKNGILRTEHIKLLLLHFHYKFCDMPQDFLYEIIEDSLGDKTHLSFSEYKTMLAKNSDIFVLMLSFLRVSKAINNKSVDFYCYIREKGNTNFYGNPTYSKSQLISLSNIAVPSVKLLKYIKEALHLDFSSDVDDMEEELDDLENFENDIESCIFSHISFNEASQKSCFIQSRESETKIESTLQREISTTENRIMFHNHFMNTLPTLSNTVESKYQFFEGYEYLGKKPINVRLFLVEDSLFYYYHSFESNSYIYSGVYLLRGVYIETNICMKKKDTQYVEIISDYNLWITRKRFYFTDDFTFQQFYTEIKKAINFRSIYETYTWDRKISSGQFGKIYRGMNKTTWSEVAIKKICKNNTDENGLRLLKNEIDITQFFSNTCISHSNIMKAFDYFEYVDTIYLVFEYINGYTLSELIQMKYLEDVTKKSIIRQIVKGLCHMQSLGIIHRDLKFENIKLFENVSK